MSALIKREKVSYFQIFLVLYQKDIFWIFLNYTHLFVGYLIHWVGQYFFNIISISFIHDMIQLKHLNFFSKINFCATFWLQISFKQHVKKQEQSKYFNDIETWLKDRNCLLAPIIKLCLFFLLYY